ncbi:hypothetical protein BD410DRAFT_182110 [Rickenella mellea]|uniref:Uncharacterized protein n=1 Tax=Rickenella mellea TaxID=50990 RepID=A0A4Y7PH25_9AGAM|nr:hypothetical protein BD410DRAFT_182110 [Rickenella mellea]
MPSEIQAAVKKNMSTFGTKTSISFEKAHLPIDGQFAFMRPGSTCKVVFYWPNEGGLVLRLRYVPSGTFEIRINGNAVPDFNNKGEGRILEPITKDFELIASDHRIAAGSRNVLTVVPTQETLRLYDVRLLDDKHRCDYLGDETSANRAVDLRGSD